MSSEEIVTLGLRSDSREATRQSSSSSRDEQRRSKPPESAASEYRAEHAFLSIHARKKEREGEGIHYPAVLSLIMIGTHGLHSVRVFSSRIEIRLYYSFAFFPHRDRRVETHQSKVNLLSPFALRRANSLHTLERLVLADA